MFNHFNKIYRLFSPQLSSSLIREKYHIPEKIKLHLELADGGWLIVNSPDLPGLVTQARNGKELLDMVNDAVLTYFDVPKKEADVIFGSLQIEGQGVISYNDKKLQTITA
jgi:predicted RNase H-like HicB family nuclease